MPAERAGYTVTIFLVDVSKSMSKLREVDLPPGPNGEERVTEMTSLEWSLQFVKLKVQEMIYNGRKTDQCGIILFGCDVTDNIINERNGGYDNVAEYVSIGQPGADTLVKLNELKPSKDLCGDPVDALIVAIETQADYLASKKTWTRKIVLVTDGESPIEMEDWDAIVQKMNDLNVSLTLVGIDFDDEDLPFVEENKPHVKLVNEQFYRKFIAAINYGVMGTCALALRETARPDIKQTRSVLMGTVLRLGEVDTQFNEAIEINVKTSKCTAIARPKSWKKFALRANEDGKPIMEPNGKEDEEDEEDEDNKNDISERVTFAQLKARTEYFVDRSEDNDEEDIKIEMDDEDMEAVLKRKKEEEQSLEKVEKEQLVKGFKYGTTFTPCPDGQFPRMPTRKGIDICGFFPALNFRRELSMGEIQYIWADPVSAQQQVALSSVVQAMEEKSSMAIARWVTKDSMDPKMGVLLPTRFEKIDCLLWAHMPFADDVRKYTFASLDKLVNKKGEEITSHPYLPTNVQMKAIDDFVDAMDLMQAGEKDEEGNRSPWFDTRLSYNPAIHRTKQALFHCAVVTDLDTNPLPPPHPELTKYFEPPKRVLRLAKPALEQCIELLKVKQVPKRVAKAKKDGHDHAVDDNDNMLLLDQKQPSGTRTQLPGSLPGTPSQRIKTQGGRTQIPHEPPVARFTQGSSPRGKAKEAEIKRKQSSDDSNTEDEEIASEDGDIVMVNASAGGSGHKPFELVSGEGEEETLLLDKAGFSKPKAKGEMRPPPSPMSPRRNGAGGHNFPLPTPARSLSPPQTRARESGGAGALHKKIPSNEMRKLSVGKDAEMNDATASAQFKPKTSQTTSADKEDEDWVMDMDTRSADRPSGRTISLSYPLRDFNKNLARGGLISKVVEDLCWIIIEVVVRRPFGNKRKEEMIDAMRRLREVCLENGEIEAWNSFVRELKEHCTIGDPGNEEFWDYVKEKGGRGLSLISRSEAHGNSEVTDIQARRFMG